MEKQFKTTFWADFTVADVFGEKAVKETFNHVFKEWRGDYRHLTSLVMTLNHKIFWHYYENKDYKMAKLYDTLWRKADEYAIKHLKDDELKFFLKTTD